MQDGYKLMFLVDMHLKTLPTRNGWEADVSPALWAALEFGKYFKPDETVLGGDFMEFNIISKYETDDFIKREGRRLRHDFELGNQILDKIDAFTKGKKVFIVGNHDARLATWIASHPQIEGLISLGYNLKLEERGYKIIPEGKLYSIGHANFGHGFYWNLHHAKKTVLEVGDNIFYGHCFDEKTELLTFYGWRKWNELKKGDLCLTLNTDSKKLEWNPINQVYVYDHDGEMIHFKSTGLDLLVDKEHGLVVKFSDKPTSKYHLITTEEGVNKKSGQLIFEVSGEMDKEPEYSEVTDDILRIIAWVQAEGSIYSIARTDYVSIFQSEDEKGYLEEIKSLLDRLGLKYKCNKRIGSRVTKKSAYRIRLDANSSLAITHFLPEKNKVPSWMWCLSARQFKVFLEEYIKGDGTSYSGRYKNTKLVFSMSREWIDYFQAMAFKCGLKTLTHWKKGSFPSSQKCAQLSLRKRRSHYISKKNITREYYKGKKWCVNVKNGTLVVRRNERATITQNTHDIQNFTKFNYKQRPIIGSSMGCLCGLDPEWRKGRPNRWVNGFGVFYFFKNGNFTFYNPIIIDGKFIWNGKIFKGEK